MRRLAAACLLAVVLAGFATVAAGRTPAAGSATPAASVAGTGAGAGREPPPTTPRDNRALAAVVVVGLLAFIATTAVLGSKTRDR